MPKLQLLSAALTIPAVALLLSAVQCTPAQRDVIRDVADAVVLTCDMIGGQSTAAIAEKAGVPERVVIQIQQSCACAKGLLCPVVFGETVGIAVTSGAANSGGAAESSAGAATVTSAGSAGAP